MNRYIFLLVIIILLVVGGLVFQSRVSHAPQPVACTMEAKLCPDGSAVGRTGPKCEFAACPNEGPLGVTSTQK